MSKRLNSLLAEWAEDKVRDASKSGFSGINVVEKLLRDPGRSTSGGGHRVLWWPRNKRLAKMHKAMHQIDSISQICLIVEHGSLRDSEGRVFDKKALVQNSSLTVRGFNDRVREARSKLQRILDV